MKDKDDNSFKRQAVNNIADILVEFPLLLFLDTIFFGIPWTIALGTRFLGVGTKWIGFGLFDRFLRRFSRGKYKISDASAEEKQGAHDTVHGVIKGSVLAPTGYVVIYGFLELLSKIFTSIASPTSAISFGNMILRLMGRGAITGGFSEPLKAYTESIGRDLAGVDKSLRMPSWLQRQSREIKRIFIILIIMISIILVFLIYALNQVI